MTAKAGFTSRAAACALALVLLQGCRPASPPSPLSDADVDAAIAAAPAEFTYRDSIRNQQSTGYEATKWITTNRNFAPFASNHFKSAKEAIQYVREFYRAGSPRVYVVNIFAEPARIQREGGPYADALYVFLPSDKAHRRVILDIYANYAKGEGYGPETDNGQERLFFWWD